MEECPNPSLGNPRILKNLAITQTLKPFYHKRAGACDQLTKTFGNLVLVYQTFQLEEYEIVAELTQQANIHYHSYVRFYGNVEDFILEYKHMTKELGFCEIKTIFDINNWIKYMRKDIEKTKEILSMKTPFARNPRNYKNSDIVKKYNRIEKIKSNFKLYGISPKETFPQETDEETARSFNSQDGHMELKVLYT